MSKNPAISSPSSHERRKALASDVQAFLDSGKKIDQIPDGVSGQDALGRSKHIVISRNRKRSAG